MKTQCSENSVFQPRIFQRSFSVHLQENNTKSKFYKKLILT